MKHQVPHDLELELARRATAKALDTYAREFPEVRPEGSWVTPDHAQLRFTVAGKTLRGTVTVAARAIELELDVPFLFRPFRAQAMKIIEQEISTWIARAKAGQLDD